MRTGPTAQVLRVENQPMLRGWSSSARCGETRSENEQGSVSVPARKLTEAERTNAADHQIRNVGGRRALDASALVIRNLRFWRLRGRPTADRHHSLDNIFVYRRNCRQCASWDAPH